MTRTYLPHRRPICNNRPAKDIYTGTYERTIDSKNRIALLPEFEKTVVSRNGKDENVADLYSLYVGVVGTSITCYDHSTFNKKKSSLDCSDFHSVSIDGQKRILIPVDIMQKYPLVSPVTISASKKGDHFTIKSSLESKVK